MRGRCTRGKLERNVISRGIIAGFLGAIELANGLGTNKPSSDVFRFRVLLGAALQLQRLLAATKRALDLNVSAFGERGRELSELAEN